MEVRQSMRFGVVGSLLSFSILFLFITSLRAEGLYTRTDELPCGNTVVQAYTTCTEDSHDVDNAVCTEQHFLFVDKKSGASVRIQGPGEPAAHRDLGGEKMGARCDGFVPEWACLWGHKGAFIGFIIDPWKLEGHSGKGSSSIDLFDLKGRRFASDRTPKGGKKFYRIWRAQGYTDVFLAPWEPIELFKTERQDKDIWLGSSHKPLH